MASRTGSWLLPILGLCIAGAYAGPVSLDVAPVRYELELVPDFDAERLVGRARMTLVNRSERTTREVPLLLYRLLSVTDVRGANGASLEYDEQVVAFDDFPKLQIDFVRVRLPDDLAPGDRTVLDVAYSGHLLGYSETGMRYVRDRIDPEFTILRMDAYSYPQTGYPSMRINRSAQLPTYDYDARITVPEGLTVANGGRLVDERTARGRTTFRYLNIRPAWRMDFAIARYDTIEAGPLRVFHFAEDAEGAERVLAGARDAFGLFTDWFGPLGGETGFAFIEIPDGWGSQADVTSVIQTAAAFRDPARMTEVYHEVSHMWNVPATDPPSPRWNEGLAQFLSELAMERIDGRPTVDPALDECIAGIRRRFEQEPRFREIPMADYGREQVTGLSYRVGMVMFAVLYRLVGHDRFTQIVGRFYRDHAESGGSTRDLVDTALRVAGDDVDLARFFDDWIFTTRWYEDVAAGASVDRLVEEYR